MAAVGMFELLANVSTVMNTLRRSVMDDCSLDQSA